MKKMKLFMDTHDKANATFPEHLTQEQFAVFYDKFTQACEAEGVVSLKAHISLEQGRAFCLTMAPSIDAVRKAHERVGLPYDTITEIETAAPGDMYFKVA